MATKKEVDLSNKIILRSVRGKVGIVIKTLPCPNPQTGNYADCVKRVDSKGDMILSEAERNDKNRDAFIPINKAIDLVDGMVFDLDNVADRFKWEAIQYCPYIAPDYYAKDSQGNSLINGNAQRYGVAELYIERPGVEANKRISRKKLIHDAETFIYTDERGAEGRVLKARLLGHRMDSMPDADVTEYLLQVAESDPEKIINLYTGGDTAIRLLFIEAKDKHVIVYKHKLYSYADNIILGATDEAAVAFLKDPNNANVLKLLKQDTYPELMGKSDEK